MALWWEGCVQVWCVGGGRYMGKYYLLESCTEFSIQNPHQKCAHARIFVANLCQPTCKHLYSG